MPYYDDETSVYSSSNTNDVLLQARKEANELKRQDKFYEKYTIPYNKYGPDGRFLRRVTIENYGSGGTGTLIRNAVSGNQYQFLNAKTNIPEYQILVGSSDQDLLFKVTESTGRFGRKEPLMLYYNSPEQFENHHFVTVSPVIKQQWYERNLALRKRINSDFTTFV